VSEVPPVPSGPWFNELAAFLGKAYWAPDTGRVAAFTKGTEQEVAFLVDALGLQPGMRVLDAGCGPGRHALTLARRGIDVVGVDRSADFIALAREHAAGIDHVTFLVGDVRALAFEAAFDAAICLCQGGFGLLGGGEGEERALAGLATALKPDGRLALSAFNAYFATRHLEAGEDFDAATGVNHEHATLRDPDGHERAFDLWTTCFTPRELRLLARAAGLTVDAVYGVSPGEYAARPPSIDRHEHLLLARRAFGIG
jgi:SAM-dependent methyltransferase